MGGTVVAERVRHMDTRYFAMENARCKGDETELDIAPNPFPPWLSKAQSTTRLSETGRIYSSAEMGLAR